MWTVLLHIVELILLNSSLVQEETITNNRDLCFYFTGRPQKTNREDTSSGAALTKIARITTIATKSGATFTPARATSKSSAAAVPRLKPRTSFTAAHSERDTNTSFEIAEGGGALEFENPFADVISREVVVMSAAPPSMVGYDD